METADQASRFGFAPGEFPDDPSDDDLRRFMLTSNPLLARYVDDLALARDLYERAVAERRWANRKRPPPPPPRKCQSHPPCRKRKDLRPVIVFDDDEFGFGPVVEHLCPSCYAKAIQRGARPAGDLDGASGTTANPVGVMALTSRPTANE